MDQETAYKLQQWIKKLIKKILTTLVLIVIAILYLQYCAVQQVKDSTPENYPDLTMEKAFSAYFEHPRWSYDEFCGDFSIIQFTGKCMYLGEEVTAELEIWSYRNSERATVHSLEIDHVIQEDWILNLLLLDVYESYEK